MSDQKSKASLRGLPHTRPSKDWPELRNEAEGDGVIGFETNCPGLS